MTIAQITKTVHNIIKDSSETELELTPQTHLIQEIGLSSVEAMLLLSDLEDVFRIQIPVTALREVETVGDLTQLVIQCLKTQ